MTNNAIQRQTMSAFCPALHKAKRVTVKKRNFYRNVPKAAFYSMDNKS
ncbi:MAG: hypothetical protein LBF19_07425 [Prevotellaceae bacterium]|nr:hypothetical protein [Prevotellaceae bacterium]